MRSQDQALDAGMARTVTGVPSSDEEQRLGALSAYAIVDRPTDPHLQGIARLASIVCDAQNAAVNMIGASEQHPVATTRESRQPIPREVSYCGIAMYEDGPVVVSDARRDPRFAELPTTTGVMASNRSYAGVQLRAAGGHPLGMLCVFDDRVREFTPVQIEALELLAGQVMEVLEARQQAARLAEAEQRFRLAFDRTPIGMLIVDLDLRLLEVNDAFADIVGHPEGALVGTSLPELVFPDDWDAASDHISRLIRGEMSSFREEHRYVRSDGTPVWAEVWCSVVRDTDGRPLRLVKQVEDISRRREQLAEVTHRAAHDHLTGLPNRLLLEDRLLQALERLDRGGEVVVLSVDLDGFKQVNDTHGHDAGDRVLQETAERLRRSVRAGDTVCRWGGDEFMIVCEDFAGSGVARDIAQRIVLMAAQPIEVDGHSIRIGASIGAVATSEPGRTPEQLLADADANLYLAKEKGRGRVQFGSRPARGVGSTPLPRAGALGG